MGDQPLVLSEEWVAAGEAFAHFGVKGMHWGVRREKDGSISAKVPVNSSGDHQEAALIRAKAKLGGGVHALSNDEITALNTRLNLEQNFHRLAAEKSTLDKGRSFIKTVTSDAKTVVDAVNTGRQVVKTANDLAGLIPDRPARTPSNSPAVPKAPGFKKQSRRMRNRKLKVVRVT